MSETAGRTKISRRVERPSKALARRVLDRAHSWLTFCGALLNAQSRSAIRALAICGVLFVGLLDYLTGYEISLSVIYIIPIALAEWFVSARFAYLIAVLSVIAWLFTDTLAGSHYSSLWAPLWNSLIRLVLYYGCIRLLGYAKSLTEHLQIKVAQRTSELQRLERELVEAGERERRRVGADLHDELGQHLAATLLAAQVLKRQLPSDRAADVARAADLVALLEQSMTITQRLAQGLQSIEMHAGGLMQALQEFAINVGEIFHIQCRFQCEAPVLVRDAGAAEQLYRIAQEATTNAIRHGKATSIDILLEPDEKGLLLEIRDNGIGFRSADPSKGLGLRIMEKRASLIGGSLDISSEAGMGTTVRCHVGDDCHRG